MNLDKVSKQWWDGIHPNDLGMMLYAEGYFQKINKILSKR